MAATTAKRAKAAATKMPVWFFPVGATGFGFS
jgi:hypothetical protein